MGTWKSDFSDNIVTTNSCGDQVQANCRLGTPGGDRALVLSDLLAALGGAPNVGDCVRTVTERGPPG